MSSLSRKGTAQLIAILSWFIVNGRFFWTLKSNYDRGGEVSRGYSAVCGEWGLFHIYCRMRQKKFHKHVAGLAAKLLRTLGKLKFYETMEKSQWKIPPYLFFISDFEVIMSINGAGVLAELMASVQFTLNKPNYKNTQQETAHERRRFSVGVSGIVE